VSDKNTPAYSYLRFSSLAQAEGDSLRRQIGLRDAWLKKHPEVRLDTSLRLEDRGVSGYKGRHRKNAKHALAQFLDLVERGRVPAGSYLIVENLDRLTREEPEESIPVVLSLIKAGVRVVQLVPAEMVYEPGMDFGRLMMMLWELARGHGESVRKSGLLLSAWSQKKEEAQRNKTPHGAMCPAWLEIVGVKSRGGSKKDFSEATYRVKADAAAAVKKVFEWCAAGQGTFGIIDRLNREGIPPIGRSGAWHRTYLKLLLDSRAVLGEYQPRKRNHPARPPDGEPIPGFYPAIIDEALWDAAHKAIKARTRRSGRPATANKNPFSGLLYDALDGQKLHVCGAPAYKYLVSAASIQKAKGALWRAFPVGAFVDGVLSQLKELEASDLFSDPGAGKVKEIGDRLREVEKRLAVAVAKFDADPESPTWSAQVDRYDKEKRVLVKELAEARMEARNPLSGSWDEAVSLMAENEPERLRAVLLATVEKILCVFVKRGEVRIAGVQVIFRGQSVRRDYLIVHQKASGGAVGTRPARSWSLSLAAVHDPAELDLRRPEDARQLESYLAKELDLEKFHTNDMKTG
jgi:DNA invertase Pin-like site-specific DNA recombinase